MGGLCSRSSTVDNASSGGFLQLNGHFSHGSGLVFQTRELKIDSNTNPSLVGEKKVDIKQLREPFTFPEVNVVQYGMDPNDIDDGIPRLSRALSDKSRSTKSTPVAVAKEGFGTSEIVSTISTNGLMNTDLKPENIIRSISAQTCLMLCENFNHQTLKEVKHMDGKLEGIFLHCFGSKRRESELKREEEKRAPKSSPSCLI